MKYIIWVLGQIVRVAHEISAISAVMRSLDGCKNLQTFRVLGNIQFLHELNYEIHYSGVRADCARSARNFKILTVYKVTHGMAAFYVGLSLRVMI